MNPSEQATAQALPYERLADAVQALLADPSVQVPARMVMPLPQGGSLFAMPAHDARLAMTKIITYTPGNVAADRPAIQGDVLVFDVRTGERLAVLDGPTVTARRTAAVSLLAARHLAAQPQGPLLLLGAGVQARAHLEAFVQGLGVRQVFICSRGAARAQALCAHARQLGCDARVVASPQEVQTVCPLVLTCTVANGVVLAGALHPQVWLGAVGAFTPAMIEVDPALTRELARAGRVVVDTADAAHEAGDLLQAGLRPHSWQTLAQSLQSSPRPGCPVLFKSCGWAGWDLAAARLACPPP